MSTIVLTTPEEPRAIISEEVRQAIATATRKQRVNATELAAELGVSVPTLARWLRERRFPAPGRDGNLGLADVMDWERSI